MFLERKFILRPYTTMDPIWKKDLTIEEYQIIHQKLEAFQKNKNKLLT